MISIAPYLAPSSGIGLRKVKLLRPLSRMPEGILRPSKFSSETVAKTSGQSMKSVNIKLEPAEKKAVLASRFEAFSGLKMSGSTAGGGVSAGFFLLSLKFFVSFELVCLLPSLPPLLSTLPGPVLGPQQLKKVIIGLSSQKETREPHLENIFTFFLGFNLFRFLQDLRNSFSFFIC